MNDYKELIETFRLVEEDEEIDIYGGALHEIADAIEQLVRERDEAIKWVPPHCNLCKHISEDGACCYKADRADWAHRPNWEWRGVEPSEN